MVRLVEPRGEVGADARDVVRGRPDEVHGRHVVDGLPLVVQTQVQGDAVPAELVDANQRGDHVEAVAIHHQDLVHLRLLRLALADGYDPGDVEVEHAVYRILLTLAKLQRHGVERRRRARAVQCAARKEHSFPKEPGRGNGRVNAAQKFSEDDV